MGRGEESKLKRNYTKTLLNEQRSRQAVRILAKRQNKFYTEIIVISFLNFATIANLYRRFSRIDLPREIILVASCNELYVRYPPE